MLLLLPPAACVQFSPTREGCTLRLSNPLYSHFHSHCAAPICLFVQFSPTREGFLRFMVESKVVYEAFEKIMAEAPVAYCE